MRGYGFLCFSLFFVFHNCSFPLLFITSSAYPLVHVPRLYCSRVHVPWLCNIYLSSFAIPFCFPVHVAVSVWSLCTVSMVSSKSLRLDVWCSHVLITPRFILIVPRLLCTVFSLSSFVLFYPNQFQLSSHLSNNLVGVFYCLSVPLSFVTSSLMPCALSPCVPLLVFVLLRQFPPIKAEF